MEAIGKYRKVICRFLPFFFRLFPLSDKPTRRAAGLADERHSRDHRYSQLFRACVTSILPGSHTVASKLLLPITVNAVTLNINQTPHKPKTQWSAGSALSFPPQLCFQRMTILPFCERNSPISGYRRR
jgi:hypothetical protein